MISFGIGMVNREITCILCQKVFTRVSPDVIWVNEMVCDKCMDELSGLDGKELAGEVSRRLKKGNNWSESSEHAIVQTIQIKKKR